MDEKRTEERRRASRLAVLINQENVAVSTTVIDSSIHGLGLEVPFAPDVQIGDNVRVRMRNLELPGEVVRFQAMDSYWQVGLRLKDTLDEPL